MAPLYPRSMSHLLRRAEHSGEAPDTHDFVGRLDELGLPPRLGPQRPLSAGVAILRHGWTGKTNLAAWLAQDVASGFERVSWRSLRDAPLPHRLVGRCPGVLSDRRRVPPTTEAERIIALLATTPARLRRVGRRGHVDRRGVALAGGGPDAAVGDAGPHGGVWGVALSADGSFACYTYGIAVPARDRAAGRL